MTQRGSKPKNVQDALWSLADWLDEADRLIDRLFMAKGVERTNSGDEVQQDMRALAVWFDANPQAASDAWQHVTTRSRVAGLTDKDGQR